MERDGDGPGACYRNTPETSRYLDRNRPEYIGGIIEIWDRPNYRFWADLTEGLRTGRPQNEAKCAGTSFFETMFADPAQLEAFLGAMHGASIRNFQVLARAFRSTATKAWPTLAGPMPSCVGRWRRHTPISGAFLSTCRRCRRSRTARLPVPGCGQDHRSLRDSSKIRCQAPR